MSRKLNCTESSLSLSDIFKLMVKDGSGDSLDCDDIHLTVQDLLKSMITVDASGNMYLNIDLSGSFTITLAENRWRLLVDATDGYKLKTQKSLNGGTTWITTNTEIY